MKLSLTSLLAVILCGLLLCEAEANIIGQRRFLPMNQAALKNRVAIVAPADPVVAAPTNKDEAGFMKRSRTGFMPIKRDVLTIRRDLATQQQTTQRKRQFTNRSDNRFITREARRAMRSEVMQVADSRSEHSRSEKPRETKPATNSSEAILGLFGDQEIERSHPFLK